MTERFELGEKVGGGPITPWTPGAAGTFGGRGLPPSDVDEPAATPSAGALGSAVGSVEPAGDSAPAPEPPAGDAPGLPGTEAAPAQELDPLELAVKVAAHTAPIAHELEAHVAGLGMAPEAASAAVTAARIWINQTVEMKAQVGTVKRTHGYAIGPRDFGLIGSGANLMTSYLNQMDKAGVSVEDAALIASWWQDRARAGAKAKPIAAPSRPTLTRYQPAAAPAPAEAGEIASLEKMMRDKRSPYWKGPDRATNQARYRELISARDEGG